MSEYEGPESRITGRIFLSDIRPVLELNLIAWHSSYVSLMSRKGSPPVYFSNRLSAIIHYHPNIFAVALSQYRES